MTNFFLHEIPFKIMISFASNHKGYDLNISKTESTQQLRPTTSCLIENSTTNNSQRTTINSVSIDHQHVRYTPSNQVLNQGATNNNKSNKHSPITPPPPYFNRNNNSNNNQKQNSISTIELDSYTIKTSSPCQSMSRKKTLNLNNSSKHPSQTHLLSYSQSQGNLELAYDDNEGEIDNTRHNKPEQTSSFMHQSNNQDEPPRPLAVTPRKIYQTAQPLNQFFGLGQHTKTTVLNDNALSGQNSSSLNQSLQMSHRANSSTTFGKPQRTILANQNIINHINANILNPVNNPNNYRY